MIEHTRTVTTHPEVVHRLVSDTLSWPSWSPIRSATIERPAGPDGVGEIRVFRTGPITSREEVTVNEPSRRFSYRLLSGLPIDDYRSDITISAIDGGSRITWRSEFSPRWPGSGGINRLLLSPFIAFMLRSLTAAAESV